MWIRKHLKDRLTGNDSPIPTQVICNEEFSPLPQTEDQKKLQHRIHELADIHGKRAGMSRRQFLRTTGGMAAAFLALNETYGCYFNVNEAEMGDAAARADCLPQDVFIFDVQTHHVRTGGHEPLFFRKLSGRFVKELEGVTPKAGDLQLPNYTKEVFFDSDTAIACISGVPSRLMSVLNADEMVETRNLLNELAGSRRMLSHGLWAPYLENPLEEAERQMTELGVDAWKFYTGVFEKDGEYPWWLDDEQRVYPFYELAKKHGRTTICVHKGLPLPGSDIEYTKPRDVKKAALDHPDLNFVIYHSAFRAANYELPPGDAYVGEGGYLEWTTDLVREREATPEMTNVYMELGTTFGHTVITHPVITGHLLGQVIRAFGVDHVIWGTDSIWWGSPQWQIEAFRRFQIPEKLQEEFGYAPITDADKEKILGLNAAKLFKLDSTCVTAFPDDGISRLKAQYRDEGGMPGNTQYGWVRRNA